MSTELTNCPLDRTHLVRCDRLQSHVIRCKRRYTGTKVPCPYNATEYVEPSEMVQHLVGCRSRMDRECQFYYSLGGGGRALVDPIEAPFVHRGIPDVVENWGID